MRLLVACQTCNRQYDASCYPLGSLFRCHCGEVVTVKQAPAHETAVVRCSGCGAPRSPGPSCTHCGSSFAVDERDLTSICPHCLSRVSDRARFCHGCGLALAAEGSVGELSEWSCPACGGEQRLHSRQFGRDLSLMECSRCAGMWLGPATFEHAIRRAEEMVVDLESPAAGQRATITKQAVRYRPCPQCKALMNRSQYGKYSRVIIDTCKEHGVWLDEGELSQILEWVRGGGLDQSRKAMHEQRMQELRKQRLGVELSRSSDWKGSGGASGSDIAVGDSFLGWLFD